MRVRRHADAMPRARRGLPRRRTSMSFCFETICAPRCRRRASRRRQTGLWRSTATPNAPLYALFADAMPPPRHRFDRQRRRATMLRERRR